MASQARSPFADQKDAPATGVYRYSLGSMLLLTFVCAAIGAALFYGARVPMIRMEFMSLFSGSSVVESSPKDRMNHLIFLLYCYASPLLLTGVAGAGMSLYLAWSRMQKSSDTSEPDWDEGLAKTETKEQISSHFQVIKKSKMD